MQERSESNNLTMFNQLQLMNQSFMEMRISNQQLLEKIEFFLSAQRKTLKKNADGSYDEEMKEVGTPLANKEGINQLLHIISMRTDSHVVQGNFDSLHYYDYIERCRKELADEVVTSCYEWGIDDSKISLIIDTIMGFLEPFISRLIDNEERKSFMSQFQSREILQNSQKNSGLLSNFSEGFGKDRP